MVIAPEHLESMLRHARTEFPNEACGLLAMNSGQVSAVFPVENAEASPVHYTLDPQGHLSAVLAIEDSGSEVGAVFHSHPRTRAIPSPTDVRLAIDPNVLYVIVSLAQETSPDVRAFRIRAGLVSEEPVHVQVTAGVES